MSFITLGMKTTLDSCSLLLRFEITVQAQTDANCTEKVIKTFILNSARCYFMASLRDSYGKTSNR